MSMKTRMLTPRKGRVMDMDLADLMCHRVGTAEKCYRLVEREFTPASAARELSGVLRESTSTLVDSSKKTCLDEQDLQKSLLLFEEEVESGQISPDEVQSKLRSSGTELDARQVYDRLKTRD